MTGRQPAAAQRPGSASGAARPRRGRNRCGRRLLGTCESLVACRARENELRAQTRAACGRFAEHQQRQAPQREPGGGPAGLGPQLQRQPTPGTGSTRPKTALGPTRHRPAGHRRAADPLNSELPALEAERPGPRRRQTATAEGTAARPLKQRPGCSAKPACSRHLLAGRPRSGSLARSGWPNNWRPSPARSSGCCSRGGAGAKRTGHGASNTTGNRRRRAPWRSQQQELQERFGTNGAAPRWRPRPSSRPAAWPCTAAMGSGAAGGGAARPWPKQDLGLRLRSKPWGGELPDPPVVEPVRQGRAWRPWSKDLRRLQERMEALEPVNCSPLEEPSRLEIRLAGFAAASNPQQGAREETMAAADSKTVVHFAPEGFLGSLPGRDGHFPRGSSPAF